MTHLDYTIVIPTTGRENLQTLLAGIEAAGEPRPARIIVADDRPGGADLELPQCTPEVEVIRTGGRGPAAARNAGWRRAATEWIAFLDDDVLVSSEWPRKLAEDLLPLGPDTAASQARLVVPLPPDRRPTDDERGTAGLETARWITADMAYRRTVLAEVGGFDERFPRAYREDSDLGLNVAKAGYLIAKGERVTTHPPKRSGPLASLRAQRGNADDALMRRKHGVLWRQQTAAGHGRLDRHALATASAVGAAALFAAGRRKAAAAAVGVWAGLTAEFAARRIAPGPLTPGEVSRMLVTSVLIPPAACYHRLRGELRHRLSRRPQAVLFDRDDTLIFDVPYLDDPEGVRPVPGAKELVHSVRSAGIRVGVVSNQSGVAKGLITPERLAAVNARVEEALGPFDTWQVCVHDDGDGCTCRKPAPGMVRQAAEALGVDVRRCVVIGDTGADVDAALAAGARGILIPTARTRPEEVVRARRRATVARDLAEAVHLAVAGTR
ncbi:HAD-IIIA family hydrolase [Amycolatopsis regifaucium]|uniref:D,D-heptose 1,7-bisphosphate phosphatase n=1 Tax=Amycolatopsis regifaucium TaxID=546365 RepID=A0A154M3Z7_9PSEU|nr:HAD-IIIA family hydrolase [Amycolatopsis regifaucium]KZB79344.1 HAD family hydrolase [Amycolatopsis regifaucium]OKA07527.1 HAD family hydrolase [Amycolatopsis regifaucium]SFH09211.1 haloacid dehalogenase superfamily, subfamily IA, variant 3 with third motif having DD or ED [Amycolatopsis regifaucium]